MLMSLRTMFYHTSQTPIHNAPTNIYTYARQAEESNKNAVNND
jgi:hypothetical protein